MMYAEFAPNGTVIGMATVLSSPPIHYAVNVLVTGVGWQYGVALSNTNSFPITVTFRLDFNGTFVTRDVQIAANSAWVNFANSVVAVPTTVGVAFLELYSSSPFSVTELLFDGPVFTTLVPATEP
jgi:hypothetical protein